MDNWISCKEKLPERNEIVDTKIDNEQGVRNECQLLLKGNLWFLKDQSMYVYYSPTHWKPIIHTQQEIVNLDSWVN